MARLRKLDPIIISKIIISIHVLQHGKVICFAFSDGTVQYRDRITMNEIYNETNLDRIMTLNQVGFQYVEESPCKSNLGHDIHDAVCMLTCVIPIRFTSSILSHQLLVSTD